MRVLRAALATAAALVLALSACSDDGGVIEDSDVDDTSGSTDTGEPEHLAADFEGAPEEVVDGRMTCLGANAPEPATGSVLELTGYVRTLADPGAETDEMPPATVEAFSSGGTSLATGFADSSKTGRVSVSVPITEDGFDGYVVVSHDGFVDWRFETNIAATDTHLGGWAWLTKPGERDAIAADLGVTLEDGTGILVGAIHDCDAFGTGAAVVTVDGDHEGVFYVEGFAPVASRTWTSSTGRFVVPNLTPGTYEVKAWGRLEGSSDLVLLSVIEDAVIEDGRMTAVALQPRVGVTK